MNRHELEKITISARQRLIEFHRASNTGHLGGNLSCIDFLSILYLKIIKKNDQFILSKGHSAGALYIALWKKGLITDQDLNEFSQDNSKLPGHPSGKYIPGLLFSTGSLGHGPSLAAGLALEKKLSNKSSKVFCLCSDGEWQEGSNWEAAIFSNHHKLDNLVLIIDQNRWQGFGSTKDIVSYDDLSSRLEAFQLEVIKIDGHDIYKIYDTLKKLDHNNGKVKVIIMDTIKGKGEKLEDTLESHYLAPK